MKKLYLIPLVALLAIFNMPNTQSQNAFQKGNMKNYHGKFGLPQPSESQKAYEKGQLQLNAGIDFLVFPYSYSYFNLYKNVSTSSTIPLTANIEYGMHEYVSLGGYAGYYSKSWSYYVQGFNEDHQADFTVVSFGARGTLHGTSLINEIPEANIDEEKWDLYASLILGIETTSWDHDWDDDQGAQPSSNTNFKLGPIFGARYMFSPNFGAFLEVGRGTYGLGRVGLSFNI